MLTAFWFTSKLFIWSKYKITIDKGNAQANDIAVVFAANPFRNS
jgi:hypothetical protein